MNSTHTYEEAIRMELATLLQEYRTYHLALKQCTVTTVENYSARLRFILRAIGPNPVLADMTPTTLKRICLERAKTCPRSAACYRYALMHFCEYLIMQEWLQANIARDIPVPKVSPVRREPIPDDVIEDLLLACERMTRPPVFRVKARAIISVLAFAGLRLQELLDLKIGDTNLQERCIQVWEGKGRKHRPVYPAPECINALRDWMQLRPATSTHDYLFTANKTRRLADFGLYSILNQVKTVAGYRDMKMTPHQFRHSCASRLAANGMPIPVIQAFLGHSSMTTTHIYVHTSTMDQAKYAHLGSLRPTEPERKEEPKPTPGKTAPVAGNEQRRRQAVRREGFGKR